MLRNGFKLAQTIQNTNDMKSEPFYSVHYVWMVNKYFIPCIVHKSIMYTNYIQKLIDTVSESKICLLYFECCIKYNHVQLEASK